VSSAPHIRARELSYSILCRPDIRWLFTHSGILLAARNSDCEFSKQPKTKNGAIGRELNPRLEPVELLNNIIFPEVPVPARPADLCPMRVPSFTALAAMLIGREAGSRRPGWRFRFPGSWCLLLRSPWTPSLWWPMREREVPAAAGRVSAGRVPQVGSACGQVRRRCICL
jgi:hypothetical protein